jgi:hypothetical protein
MILVIDVTKGIQTQTAECLVIGDILTDQVVVVLNKVRFKIKLHLEYEWLSPPKQQPADSLLLTYALDCMIQVTRLLVVGTLLLARNHVYFY